MVLRAAAVRALLVPAILAGSPPSASSGLLESGLNRLYNFDFARSSATFNKYIRERPGDPVGHVFKASVYLFSELDRLGVLEAEFFKDDARLKDKRLLKPDPAARREIMDSLSRAEELAASDLKTNANDTNALFALCLSDGIRMDYLTLIEKKLWGGYSFAKKAHGHAVRVLEIEPQFYDVYLSIGFSEYLVGSLPFLIRWFARRDFDGVQGSKPLAEERLQLAATRGRYLGPFARILLSLMHLRGMRLADCRNELALFLAEYPENPLARRELAKVEKLLEAANGGK